MKHEIDDFLGELRLGKQLTTTRQVAARGLIVILGLVLLVLGRTLDLIGPAAAVSTLLAVIVLGLTLLNIYELLGGSSDRGGTYTLIHETLGGLGGFFVGWSILAGSGALTAAFTRAAADRIAQLFMVKASAVPYLALGLFVALVLIQLFRLLPRRELLWPATLILFLALCIVFMGVLRRVGIISGRGPSTIAMGGFLRAAAWVAVIYAAIEAILASRRQIRNPARDLPRGLSSALLVGGVLFAVMQVLISGISTPVVNEQGTGLIEAIGKVGALSGWAVNATAFASLLLAANVCLMTGIRQLHALARQGAFPDSLRRLRLPFRVPPYLFGLLFVITAPLVFWAPVSWLMDLAAVFFLVPVILINLAAISSRRLEPERRRSYIVPFYPLVPSVALFISAALLFALPLPGILGAVAWLVLGSGFYLAYSRMHLMEAKEGVLVFGREPEREKRGGGWRILVPLSAGAERHLVLTLATSLARQTDGEVVPLQVIPIADPLAIEEGRRLAKERNTLFQWSTRMAERSGVPTFPITRLARSVSEGILETADEEQCDLILLSWSIRSARQGVSMGQVLDPVVRRAPCDVAVVGFHPDRLLAGKGEANAEGGLPLPVKSVLVPTAGGPHAPLATRLALLLAHEYGATASAVYVADPEATQEELAEGQSRIRHTLETMRAQMADLSEKDGRKVGLDAIPLESRVIKAGSVVEGIAQAGAESDLVFIGASEESLIDQVLFGTVPEQVARASPSPVVMVKRFRGLHRFWLQRAWDALFGALPTLSRSEQVTIYRQVRRGVRPDADFFVMIGLSAIIATYGLLQDSTAVIIGAMLVAPLFTPILAFSLAIVQGDIRLLRLAVESALKGIAVAIGLAVLLTGLSPLRSVTHEIVARTHPNLFDLAVALASGAAGAYAIARKDVAASLPGVAIAAALVPPLGVAGIGLAMGDPRIAWGGSLLFMTNLIAITLSGSVTLILLGFRPTARAEREARLRLGLVASLVLLTAITIPLAVVFVRSVNESRVRQTIDQVLTQNLETHSDFQLAGFEFRDQGDQVEITATIYAHGPGSEGLAVELREELARGLGRSVNLRLMSIAVNQIDLANP
jgi:uncharacterized hydrophobic protein (TIGR00271 family)